MSRTRRRPAWLRPAFVGAALIALVVVALGAGRFLNETRAVTGSGGSPPSTVGRTTFSQTVFGTHSDYLDFVRHGGISFMAEPPYAGRPLTDADLGPELFRVQQKIEGSGKGSTYTPVEGDAAFIPAGEPIYAVKGYVPTFRLAGHHDGRLWLYEADTNPKAQTGADLLDIRGRVADIALLDPRDPRTVVGRITARPVVDDLVRLVLAAPIDLSRLPKGSDVLLAFDLSDGTAVVRQYSSNDGVLQRGIIVSGAFRDAVRPP